MFGRILGGIAGKIGLSDYTSGRDYGRQRHERRMGQAFSERMSNTAMQRGVKDLEAAGLNRVLAAGGQPASSPTSSGGGVSGQQAQEDLIADIQAQEQTKLLSTSGKKMKQDIAKSKEDAKVSIEAAKKLRAETKNTESIGRKLKVQSTGWEAAENVINKLKKSSNIPAAARKHKLKTPTKSSQIKKKWKLRD